jgi:hypothetical protein
VTRRIVTAAAVVTVVVGIAILLAPPDARPSVLRVAILALGTAAAWLLLGRASVVTRSSPERFEQELRRPAPATTEVPTLKSIDTTLRMSTASAFGVEFMLKPLLRELVAWRLTRERNVDLARDPAAARAIMGEPLWRLLHVEDPLRDHRAPGIRLPEVEAAIDDLERI